jgi:hypothetical protein
MAKPDIVIPRLLEELVNSDRWPANDRSAIPREIVRRIAPDEDQLLLASWPFRILRQVVSDQIVRDPDLNPPGLDFDLAVHLGDFGCDAPLVLDFQLDLNHPRVVRLEWPGGKAPTRWTVVSDDLEAFINAVGL